MFDYEEFLGIKKLLNFALKISYFLIMCIVIFILIKIAKLLYFYDIDWNTVSNGLNILLDWKIIVIIICVMFKEDFSGFIKRFNLFKLSDMVQIQAQTQQIPINSSNKDIDNSSSNIKNENTRNSEKNSIDLLNEQLKFERILNCIYGTQLKILECIKTYQKIDKRYIFNTQYQEHIYLCNSFRVNIVSLDDYLRLLFNLNLIKYDNDNMIILTDEGIRFMEYKYKNYPILFRAL